jgi:methylated-DNA-protein-cysteine methyltransferase-like protein
MSKATTPTYIDRVYEVTRRVPFGKVTTYGAIADYLDLGSARMVGWALNKCGGIEPRVPAHRVVNRKGELSGRNFFATPTMMQQFLENEGLIIENDTIQNFKENLWNPSVELS